MRPGVPGHKSGSLSCLQASGSGMAKDMSDWVDGTAEVPPFSLLRGSRLDSGKYGRVLYARKLALCGEELRRPSPASPGILLRGLLSTRFPILDEPEGSNITDPS